MVEETTDTSGNRQGAEVPPGLSPDINDWMFDVDDPNYKNQETLLAIYKAYNDLPEGWKRTRDSHGRHIFVHVDGRTSFRNPARENVKRVLAEMEEKDPDVWSKPTEGSTKTAKIKKLRRMIKVGTPMHAVETQARLDGIDMDVVMSDTDDDASERKKADAKPAAKKKKEQSNSVALTADERRELKRLRKMLDAGVPLPAVEQQARLKGIVDPALLKVDVDAVDVPPPEMEAEEETKAEESAGPALFCIVEDNGVKTIEFTPGDSPIAVLVRRTVQTLKSRNASPFAALSVTLADMYNALGSLRGVRKSRDAYNSAGAEDHASSPSDVRSHRRPFLETLSSIGSRPPLSKRHRADIEGLDDLISLIEVHCSDLIDEHRSKVEAGTFDFESLVELFEPGTRVVARNAFASGVDVMCEVVWSKYEEGRTLFGMTRRFRVGFQFLVAVGGEGQFTLAEFAESMEKFDGNRDIMTLPFVPLAAFGEAGARELIESFRGRGGMYACCAAGANFLSYSKGSFYAKGGGRSSTGRDSHAAALRMSGRVMVDNQGSYEAGYTLNVGYDPMVDVIKTKCKEYMLYMRRLKQAASGGAAPANTSDDMVLFSCIPDEYLAMTWPAVVGFSFTSKAWGDVLLDGLSDIDFSESTFDHLVLPRARKRMIKALVRHSSDAFNDIVAGKGEGSVFLLYGPPGVGKTLTAEAISEMLHRPLYTVSLGQLGTTPAELESKLGEILELCGRWDALVLLDEADIFLEKRTAGSGSSLERNAMVSVMLRLVEYFRGVLFLTSNRVDALDPAFKTRITLALRYEALDRDARTEVWTNLLRASGQGAAIEEGRIVPMELAEHELNGREIKNAIRLAMALAEEDEEPLEQAYITETVEILMDFNAKMDSAGEY